MNQPNKKAWKDYLLSSGLPLEYSVAQIIENIVGWQLDEFKYKRKDEQGVEKVFSVDLHSTHINVDNNLRLEVLVECKYRHDGTQWIFTPRKYEFWSSFKDLFVPLDQCSISRQLNYSLFKTYNDLYQLCGKGIEIQPSHGTNPKAIKQAIQQLRYAVTANATASLNAQISDSLSDPIPIMAIVPIIVTTAELWRMKESTTLEDIRNAEKLEDIAQQEEILVVYESPDQLSKRDSYDMFYEMINKDKISMLDDIFKQSIKLDFDPKVLNHKYRRSIFRQIYPILTEKHLLLTSF